MSKLNVFQEWCKGILPIVQAAAGGAEIEYLSHTGKWCDRGDGLAETFKPRLKYRIKPRTIKVNGFDVPEPMREEPAHGSMYFVASPTDADYNKQYFWYDDEMDSRVISRGIGHTTKEAAIAHSKAMLGIDPNQPEE